MNFQELIQTLPNGFHDAELRHLEMDYVHRRLYLDLDVWIGEMKNADKRELYRSARLSLDKVAFLIIESPDTRYDWLDPGSIRIDAGEGCPKQSSCSIPPIPAGSFSAWFYLGKLNSFLHIAAEHAFLEWTGLEVNRSDMDSARTQKAAAMLAEWQTRDWDHLQCALSAFLPEAIEVVARAYHDESDARQRERLIHLLWEFRDPGAIPTLAEALKDPSDRVWKEALDGLVTLGASSLSYLETARDAQLQSSVMRPWLDEAIEQIQGNAKEASE